MNFTYANYQNSINNAQASNANGAVKIGYFKLGDGEEALVRFNISSTDDLMFASVHKAIFGKKFEGLPGFGGISCLNDFGSFTNTCPLCSAANAGHPVIDKAKKLVYVPMLVSYKDKSTGTWTAPQPVIWERPVGFARELAAALNDYGDLRKQLLKVSRIGSQKDTRYTLAYAMPTVFKPEMIPEDFSAFNNFNIAKHSYWEKSAEEINQYLTEGKFPDPRAEAPQQTAPAAPVQTPTTPATQQFGAPFVPQQPVAQTYAPQTTTTPWEAPAAPVQQPVAQPTQPVRNFNGGGTTFTF